MNGTNIPSLARRHEPLINHPPIQILEERFDVLVLLRRHIVDHVRVLPQVEREDDGKPRKLPNFVIVHECRVQRMFLRVVVDDDPADTARASHFLDVRDEVIPTSVLLLRCIGKRRIVSRRFRAALELLEVVLVHAHAIKLESETATKLVHDVCVAARVVVFELSDFLEYEIRMLYIAFVETKMYFYLLVGNAVEGREDERARGIGHGKWLADSVASIPALLGRGECEVRHEC
jgi:hypothetical protein